MNLTKKLRFLFRFLSAVVKKQYRLVFLGLGLGVLFYFFLPKILLLIPSPQKTIKIGMTGQYTTDTLPQEVLDYISIGLTKISENGEVSSGLSENWTVSDDGKIYTFKIGQNDINWHDNKLFEIKDINYNFKDITSSTTDDDISFSLKEPFSPFPSVVSRPLFRKGLIGLGDYKINKIIKNGKFVETISLKPYKKSNLPKLVIKFYKSEMDLKTGFNLGEVNQAGEIFGKDNISLGNSVKISENILNNVYMGIFFNTDKIPFSSKSFRQALAYAIPKETGKNRALGPINPENWAYNPDVKLYKQDTVKAKSLLEKEKIDNQTIIKISTLPQYQDVAQSISSNWQQIGINSEVNVISIIPEDYDVLLIAREIPKDPDQYYFWHSTQTGNVSNFKSPRIDKLLEDGRKTVDEEERKTLYFDFQRFLVEESPVVFLTHPITYSIIRGQ